MKTRKTKTETEKASYDEEDASSDESVKSTSKKSAKESVKRRHGKLPLMVLTKRDAPLEGQELARALMDTSDALAERSQDENEITVRGLTRRADIPAVVAWLRKWDDSLEDGTYISRADQKELLSKYTFEQFYELFKVKERTLMKKGNFCN